MGFYDLSKEQRVDLVHTIESDILHDLQKKRTETILKYFSDEDTYIRKTGYLGIGKIYKNNKVDTSIIISLLNGLIESELEKVRQTTINAAGELGKINFENVEHFFDKGLFDKHHSVRNAVIGSIKKWGRKTQLPF